MILYDYLFYRLYQFYRNNLGEKDSEIFVSGAISVLQLFNILTVLYLIPALDMKNINVYYIGTIGVVILLLNFRNYLHKEKVERIINKWKKEAKRKKIIWLAVLLVYVIVTLGLYGFSLSKMSG